MEEKIKEIKKGVEKVIKSVLDIKTDEDCCEWLKITDFLTDKNKVSVNDLRKGNYYVFFMTTVDMERDLTVKHNLHHGEFLKFECGVSKFGFFIKNDEIVSIHNIGYDGLGDKAWEFYNVDKELFENYLKLEDLLKKDIDFSGLKFCKSDF